MTPKKLEDRSKYDHLDQDGDGVVSDRELDQGKAILDMDLMEAKSDSQRRMAWICLLSIIVLTVLLVSPAVSEDRVDALSDLVGLFYISMAGIVGAHMGVQAWMTKK
ncbi:MAG: hypothetical protein VX004_00325 [SAR324 cluster bacterium]|nr:hypothetical protein [SAR324 cluster bacterium]